jgi:hypothetical protein
LPWICSMQEQTSINNHAKISILHYNHPNIQCISSLKCNI